MGMETLRKAIEVTQGQLAQLIVTVGELASAVRVEIARREDLERRVGLVETAMTQQQRRADTSSDARRNALIVLAVSSAIGLLSSLALLALSHVTFH